MKSLIEIARIVTKKRVRKIEIFDDYNLRNKSSKFNEFYEAVSKNLFRNDRDAATHLYKCTPKDARYRQLKSRFRRRLLNTLFFLDVNKPAAASYERAIFTCNKEWALVKILQEYDAHLSAREVAKSILTTAKKYHLTDAIVNTARILRDYAAADGDFKSWQTYNEILQASTQTYQDELLSEQLSQQLSLIYRDPRVQEELSMDIDASCQLVLRLAQKHNSPIIQYASYLMYVMQAEMAGKYDFVLQICKQAESYLIESPEFYQEDKLIVFFTKRMSVYLRSRDFRNGQAAAEDCLQQFTPGSRHWFQFMETYLLLALHTENYLKAFAIYNGAVRHRKFKNLDTQRKEVWRLFECYLHFLKKEVAVETKVEPVLQRAFDEADYLKWSPVSQYGRDEKIYILLHTFLQFALLVERQEFSDAGFQLEQLRKMANRQLDRELFFRAIQFIRLLQGIQRADYQCPKVRNSDKYLQLLKENPITYRGIPSHLEIIPYSTFYHIILRRLNEVG